MRADHSALQTLARAELARCGRVLLEQVPGMWLDPAKVAVQCTLRGRTYRGKAFPMQQLIQLNPGYFAAVGDAYRQTIAHEYAHLVIWAFHQGQRAERSHGPRWQLLMQRFGYSGERSSAYDADAIDKAMPPRAKYLHMAQCGCSFEVSARMHALIQGGQVRVCGKHRQRLIPSGQPFAQRLGQRIGSMFGAT